ncbi:MAG: UvrD-helicase domain-containing protein [Fulvimonas sp.]|nr:UvrD-helicase domain-containing protein [Fulvimonas sp.]
MTDPAVVAGWTALPLTHAEGAGGRCLIEASAGTGKTWTIAVLYLRLLLEQGLTPRQLVVTTFTDAAAQELRERIRARLRWATRQARRFEAGFRVGDGAPEELRWLQRRWQDETAPATGDALRLKLAEAELDLAPVGTLHALCRRVLDAHPLESGGALGGGAMVATAALDAELVTDQWRELAQSPDELDAGDRAWWKGGRKKFTDALKAAIEPGVRVQVIGEAAIDALMRPEQAARIRAWIGDGAQFKASNSRLKKALLTLADYIEAGDRSRALPKKVCEDLSAPLETQLKPALVAAAEDDPLLAFARKTAALLTDPELPARSAALERYRKRLLARREARLRERDEIGFDSLIDRVREALAPGNALADALFRAWPVALVDEFQDTDARQYAILDAIYRDAHGARRGRLVMIGDPKQAIYRFRGGDIHTYLQAARSADCRLRLAVNYRSTGKLIAGLNAFHAAAGKALSQFTQDIVYEPMRAGADIAPLTVDGRPLARPLVLHFRAEPPANKDDRVDAALEACANHIVALLAGTHRIGEVPLQPGDLAVLLPQNTHIAQLRRKLQQRGVPCAGAGRSNVFATEIARELQLVLYAVEHREEGVMWAALTTRLLGVPLDRLRALEQTPARWLAEVQRFTEWQRQWRQEGVLALVQSLLAAAAPRFLAGVEGERDLTDLRHLGELLQQRERERPGSAQLIDWLAAQRDEDAAEDEERQQRIESDTRRVQLMTLHKSKGLEFPVVLLPLMWAHEGRDIKLPLRSCAEGERELVLGGPDHAEACAQAAREDQDERFRILYVALTRARLACHVYALPPTRCADGKTKAPLVDPHRSALDAMLDRAWRNGEAVLDRLDGVDFRRDDWPWPRLCHAPERGDAASALRALPLPPARPMRQLWSFSALAHVQGTALEEPPAADELGLPAVAADIDALPAAAVAAPHPELLALSPWRGAAFGNALHAIFERRVPVLPMAEQSALIRRCLLEEGVREGDEAEALVARIAARIEATLAAEILPGCTLAALPPRAQRAEMAFHYLLDDVSLAAVRRACAEHGEPALVPRGAAGTLRGLMSGKIDLVFEHAGRFHVLDYKSNWLGDTLDAYRPEQLGAAMDAHHYRFQALLYTLALDRYLRRRVPRYARSQRLGEAVYLFVRAAGLAPRAGLWRQRFDEALLDAVDRALGAPAEAA